MALEMFLAVASAEIYAKFQADSLLQSYEPLEGLQVSVHKSMSFEDAIHWTSHMLREDFEKTQKEKKREGETREDNADDIGKVSTLEKEKGDFVVTLFSGFVDRNLKE